MAPITQAFVLGAGLGTRLRPLTEDLPKPLIPIFQKPLITFALDHLIDIGIKRFVINTHRLPELFDSSFPDNHYANCPIKFVNEPVLLETGGGIKNIENELGDEPFITYSGDVLTDVDLRPLIAEHFRRGNDVTLGLRKTDLAAAIAFRDGGVLDISNRYGVAGEYDFANIAVWNRSIFEKIPPQKKISFIPVVGDWIGAGGKIGGVVLDDGKWFNIGSRDEYLDVHRDLSGSDLGFPRYPIPDAEWNRPVHASAIVDPTAQVRGCSVIGRNCRVEPQVVLEDTILWPGSQIASRSELIGCIVRSGGNVSGTYQDIDI